MMSTVSSLTVNSLTVEPQILGLGQTDITVSATISYNYNRPIVSFRVFLHRASGLGIGINLMRVGDSNRWTGTGRIAPDVPDSLLTNGSRVSISFEAPGNPIRLSFNAPEITVRLQRTGVVDTIPPSISQPTVEPQPLGLGPSQLRLSAIVTDNVGVDAMTATIYLGESHGGEIVHFDRPIQNDIWEFTYDIIEDVPDLVELQIIFQAYDYAGNSSFIDTRATIQRHRDTQAPTIQSTMVQPSTLGPGQTDIIVSVRATDNTGVQSVYASISSGSQQIGTDVSLSHSSSTDMWTGTLTFPTDTHDGDYSINIRAVDAAGNHTVGDPVIVRLQRHLETTEQCQITLLSSGAATIDCTRSQDGECQFKISVSGPITMRCQSPNSLSKENMQSS